MERSGALKRALWPVLLLLVACGGGGGDDEPAPAGAAPVITAQPQPVTVTVGQTASFSVIATGTAPLAYQWRRNGTPIAGATSNVYTTPVTVAGDNGAQFSVVVGNAGGSTTSANALLTVGAALYSITANVSGLAGGNLTLQNNGAGTVEVTANGVVTIATGVASGAAYNVTITSSPAGLTCVVGNGSGVVAAADVSNITVTCSAAPPVETGARYIEVWSSADTSNDYQLAVVDPANPATLLPVDDVPAAGPFGQLVHVYGGTWNAASGVLEDPGVRHVVYWKNGSLYRVSLDKGGAPPAPVRLSTETLAQPTGMALAAQNRDGSDAVISYTIPVGSSSATRYVSLLAAPDDPVRTAPTFPGDPVSALPLGYALDAATGQISALLWSSVRAGGGGRLFRTDPDLTDPVNVATFTGLPSMAWLDGRGRMARGTFFVADNALWRYDDAAGSVRNVFSDIVEWRGAQPDDTHVHALVTTAGGPRLVRAPDLADSTGVVISSDAVLGGTGQNMKQTRDHIIVLTDSAATATSIRKSDGALVTLPNAAGLLFTWQAAVVGLRGGGNTSGNRVFYSYIDLNTGQQKLGSVLADGTDRRELNGFSSTYTALPATLPPHRLAGANELTSQPFARFLIKDGNQLRWVEAATGESTATVGNWTVSTSLPQVDTARYGYAGMGRVGAFGFESSSSGPERADAWLVSDQPGSLRRLTNNIP